MNKLGRPKLPDEKRRSIGLRLRLNREEMEQLKYISKVLNKDMTRFLRDTIENTYKELKEKENDK